VTIVSKLSEKIRVVEDSSTEEYEIPEWDVTVEIRSITARSRARFVAEIANPDGTTNVNDPDRIEGMWWHVISQSCYDPETGELVFEEGDQEWLFERNARIINDLASVCMAASGLSETAVDEAGKGSLASPTAEDDETLSDASTSD
jgi:hypothetical protein|tara:strand:- start:3172 stop:3609 length:438 start_codon:yes stop_codon:yes gene_type:complete